MPKFNIHLVLDTVEEIEADIAKALADFNSALAKAGHQVASAKLTSDTSTVDVTPKPVVVEKAEKPAVPTHSTLDDVKA